LDRHEEMRWAHEKSRGSTAIRVSRAWISLRLHDSSVLRYVSFLLLSGSDISPECLVESLGFWTVESVESARCCPAKKK
jgi:hypothetical protein